MATYWTPDGYIDHSAHFWPWELRCPSCFVIAIAPELLEALEILRERVGRPLSLASAYRCPRHNAAVGGAESSQHLYGLAVDLETPVDLSDALAVNRFSGIGSTGSLATHLDVRHVKPSTNWTDSTPDDPARWEY